MKIRSKTKGFTLIEILTAVMIIGVISTIIFASLDKIRSKSRDATRVADMEQLDLAIKIYRSVNESYPTASSDGAIGALSVLVDENLIDVLPEDPGGNQYYYWDTTNTGGCGASKYALEYYLEDDTAGAACGNSGATAIIR